MGKNRTSCRSISYSLFPISRLICVYPRLIVFGFTIYDSRFAIHVLAG